MPAYSLVVPILPYLALLGLLAAVLAGLCAAFWPWVLPRLITFLSNLLEARRERLRRQSSRLAKRVLR